MVFVKTRKGVFLALLVTMIVSSSFYGSVPAVHSSVYVETITDLFKYVKGIHFRIYTPTSDESVTIDLGYEIIDEENIDGQQTWKIEFFSNLVPYNESRGALWISKDTGEAIRFEGDY